MFLHFTSVTFINNPTFSGKTFQGMEEEEEEANPYIDVNQIPQNEEIIGKFTELADKYFKEGVDDQNFAKRRELFYKDTKAEFEQRKYQLCLIDILVFPIRKQVTYSTSGSFDKVLQYQTLSMNIYVCIIIGRPISFK